MTDLLTDSYCIKEGYKAHTSPDYFVDEAGEITFQPLVYPKAAEAASALGCSRVIDIGCGHAQKLVKLHPDLEIVGVDFGSNIEWCRREYGFGSWVEWNIEDDPLPELPVQGSVIVCADVIEHLVNPRILLEHLRALLQGAAVAFLSTPERDICRGVDHCGPPSNPAHVREWNSDELRQLLVSTGFNPTMGLTASNDVTYRETTILATLRH